MMRIQLKTILLLWALLASVTVGAQQPKVVFLSGSHAMARVATSSNYLLLPVEEKAAMSHVRVIADTKAQQDINVKLAVDAVDYYVTLDLRPYKGRQLLLDIHHDGKARSEAALRDQVCWKQMRTTDSFDTNNRERFRPLYHHTPAYGWMNDPNGLVWADGLWHLYYQYNPYGSQWENMHWGHATSRDLIHWQQQPVALAPDALGTIFSGSCVVDKDNTAGFGRGAIVALFTSAGESQTQSLAYSTDGGQTFTKYSGNPVITSNVVDFRDPHVFWNEATHRWNLVLAAGQEIRFYSSANLKDWTYESAFGSGHGSHDGVWECPDLMKLPVKGTDQEKWLLIVNINPGGPFGGSATQYFTGQFDGHKFICDEQSSTAKWMDYGKDHYATITFSNAPEGRTVALPWMSNWEYANQVPTQQYRSGNAIARELGLYNYGGRTWVSVVPVKEMSLARGAKTKRLTPACELVADLKGPATLTLSNDKGEKVTVTLDDKTGTLTMDRTQSGDTAFSRTFPGTTSAPTHGTISQLRIFIDKCSIEIFDADGKMAMTNLVFPSTPYNQLAVRGKVRTTIYPIR